MSRPVECTGDASTCTAGNGDEDGIPCPSCQAENDMAAAEYLKDELDMRGVTSVRFKA